MIGLRGLPPTYGGPETNVDELSMRLISAGHHVTVYCMANRYIEKPKYLRGIRLIYIPTIRSKNFEMIIYCILATLHVLAVRTDVVNFHAVGPASMSFFTWLGRLPSVVTIRGLDWTRSKWNRAARLYLKFAMWIAAKFADEIICVSTTMQKFVEKRYRREATYIPNGVKPKVSMPRGETSDRFGLEAQRYVLFVGRLVSEKNVDELIHAFRNIETDFKLVIVGGSEDDTFAHLQDMAVNDSRIVLTGPIYGPELYRLYANAALFVLPSVVEGLPTVLLEALSFNLPLLVSDIPANVELVSDGNERLADTFRAGDVGDLTHQLSVTLRELNLKRRRAAVKAPRLLLRYDWGILAKETIAIYARAVGKA